MQYGWIGREARHQLALFFSWSWTRGSHRCLSRDNGKTILLGEGTCSPTKDEAPVMPWTLVKYLSNSLPFPLFSATSQNWYAITYTYPSNGSAIF